MMFNKMKIRNYCLCIAIFVVGMFCVSIANVFGGFYSSVAVIEAILATILAYDVFDKEGAFKDSMISVILVSIILLFGLTFFVVNDILSISVYSEGVLDFWGVSVVISQLLSIVFVVYTLVVIAMSCNKSGIEIIDDMETKKIDKELSKKTKSNADAYDVHADVNYERKKLNEKVEPKSIENKMKKTVPYMEEEK